MAADLGLYFSSGEQAWWWSARGGGQLGVYDLTQGGKTPFLLRIYFGDFIDLSTDKDIISQAISII